MTLLIFAKRWGVERLGRAFLGTIIIFALCAGVAFGQIVCTSCTCSGNSGQTLNNICYAGGQVMAGSTNAYIIYYGSWVSSTQSTINRWLSTVGGTSLFGIDTAYQDSTAARVQNIVNYPFNGSTYTHSYQDNQSLGLQLNGDGDIRTIITNAISGGHLPPDSDGVYFVLTAWNVSQVNSPLGTFCSDYIAYHKSSTEVVSGYTIKYAMVGNPLYSARCSQIFDGNIRNGDNTTPNGSIAADGTINLIFHELSEAVTDSRFAPSPAPLAWGGTSPTPNENGDLCEWNFTDAVGFGHLPFASNGSHYNVTIAGANYLLQKLFQVRNTGIPTQGTFYPGSCVLGNMSISSGKNPSVKGELVRLTANVAGLAGLTPTGTVTFYFGYGGQIGSPAH